MAARHADTIDIVGKQGQLYRISGPGQGLQGVELAPRSTGLLDDAPVKPIWYKTMFGQSMIDWEWERRDIVATLNIGTELGVDPERDPDAWHDLFDDIKQQFSFTEDTPIKYGSADGDRMLYVRQLERPKIFTAYQFEGKDPKLWSFGSIILTLACEFPFFVGPSEFWEWEFDGPGHHWVQMPFYNPGDVPIWPVYNVTWGSQYRFPDFSWGNEKFGSGVADLGKTVLTPMLAPGENCEIQTRPDLETYQAENDAPVTLRTKGIDFEYPIPPGAGDPNPENGAVFSADCTTDGGAVRMELQRWYSSPYARPRLTRALAGVS